MTSSGPPARDPVERRRLAATFDTAADLYDRVRPGFPAEALPWVLGPSSHDVLDLGAGTGKLTRLLVESGLNVIAVDVSPNMLDRLREHLTQVEARVGTAESTGLADESVDAVTVGSAFHWFDRPQADEEIARVLRPGGVVGLLWNRMAPDSPVYRAFLSVQDEQLEPRVDDHAAVVLDTGWFGPTERRDFPHTETTTLDGLVDLVASRSYVIAMAESEQSEFLQRVRRAVEPLAGPADTIEIPYLTVALRAYRR